MTSLSYVCLPFEKGWMFNNLLDNYENMVTQLLNESMTNRRQEPILKNGAGILLIF